MKVPSAEGPLTGKDAVSFSYTTIPPFNVVSCNPTGLVSNSRTNVAPTIYFSHPLVHENGLADDMDWAPKIKPAPPKGSWKIFGGNRTAIQYETEGNVNWPMATAYTVKVRTCEFFEFSFEIYLFILNLRPRRGCVRLMEIHWRKGMHSNSILLLWRWRTFSLLD